MVKVLQCYFVLCCLNLVCELLFFRLDEGWLDVLVLEFVPFAVRAGWLLCHSDLPVLGWVVGDGYRVQFVSLFLKDVGLGFVETGSIIT